MALFLRQSTASQEVPLGYFVDSTDGNSEETGLTIANTDILVWKTGATALAAKNSGGATHISNGIYYAVLDATDTGTIGPLKLFVHVAGALTVVVECCVLDEAVYDALFGTSALATVGGAVASVAGAVGSVAAGGISNASFNADVGSTAIATNIIGIAAEKGVVHALTVTTYAEPGQEAPAATNTIAVKLGYLFKGFLNKKTKTATASNLYDSTGATVDHKTTDSDDGTTGTRGKWVSGP